MIIEYSLLFKFISVNNSELIYKAHVLITFAMNLVILCSLSILSILVLKILK
ncbi:hypothetical protein SDC9_179222 [bioreactor metagenome]|uniref:Uncharacterized protein n=1 Tax=bioreactor metagenome TaxID=1076179 RepID=A0A645GYD1_9ZZZZ